MAFDLPIGPGPYNPLGPPNYPPYAPYPTPTTTTKEFKMSLGEQKDAPDKVYSARIFTDHKKANKFMDINEVLNVAFHETIDSGVYFVVTYVL